MTDLNTLADRYAVLKEQSDLIAKELASLRSELLATGREVIEGERVLIKVQLIESERIDSKLARAKLDDETLAAIMVKSLSERLNVKPKLS